MRNEGEEEEPRRGGTSQYRGVKFLLERACKQLLDADPPGTRAVPAARRLAEEYLERGEAVSARVVRIRLESGRADPLALTDA